MPPRRRRPACPAPRPAPTRSPSDVDNLSTEIDASVDPITVNGSTPACANVTRVVITGTAIANTVTVLTGRAGTVTADLNHGADTLTAIGRAVGPIFGDVGNARLTSPAVDGSILQGGADDDRRSAAAAPTRSRAAPARTRCGPGAAAAPTTAATTPTR
ncbi:MAG TPA: hypothetical protein VG474_13065 [Solirubrobacteraceae bacterium]|nr:hypothetical protein [Solirubrobacteraceae bacterium]